MRKLLMLGAAALAFHAVPAMAAPFTVTGVAIQGDNVPIALAASPGNAAIPTETVTAGRFTLTTTLGTFFAWCVDLYHTVSLGTGQNLAYNLGPVTTNNAPTPVTLTTAQTTGIAQLASYGNTLTGSGQGTTDALAAVQLAIWQVEYPGFSYSAPSLDGLVSTARTNASAIPASDIGLLAVNGTQTFVVGQGTSLAVVPVPEPAAVAVVAAGLLALAGVRRRA